MKKLLALLICLNLTTLSCLGVEQIQPKIDTTSSPNLDKIIINNIESEMGSQRLERASIEKNSDNSNLKHDSNSILYTALMYIPNRIVDLTDIFSLSLGFGPEASCEIFITEFCQFSAAYGDRYFIKKAYNRQYGGGYSSGYNTGYFCRRKRLAITDYTFGTVEPYFIIDQDYLTPCPCKEPYSNGILDFWRLGIHVGWIVDISASIHPVAIANFFTGFFLIRLTDTEEL